MDPKLCILVLLVLAAVVYHQVNAEFYFQRVLPKPEELKEFDLKCSPGRTTVRIEEKTEKGLFDSEDYEDKDTSEVLRSHLNIGTNKEVCKVCVCSVDGKDEHCSQRPTMNVNECLRMTRIAKEFQSYEPYDHTRNLANRIRRDYIWHNDEIPYDPKAKCKRSHSYYTNNVSANDTDINVASDLESVLDYADKDICYYCVCSVSGNQVGCLSRQAWFCEYYRLIRERGAARDRYAKMFQQDRPTYFRQLSWRMRRTMDDGMYEFLQTVGGHDLQIDEGKCIPFVSEYTDCTEENRCTGCSRCTCSADNTWSCQLFSDCGDEEFVDEISFDQTLNSIQNELKQQNFETYSPTTYAPRYGSLEDKALLLDEGEEAKLDMDKQIQAMLRTKRSVGDQTNHTSEGVKFYPTVDEVNEDTLKTGNLSGTLQVHKLEGLATPKLASRRTGVLKTDDLSKTSLQIEYNQPTLYDNHITYNKIDAAVHNAEKYDVISQERISKVIGNHTQKQKDKNLSKLVVNELKPGAEVIGDKKAPVMSNITFTSENDTLTAMTFIAGNLLNKLWNLKKDSEEDSKEAEALKHDKIVDLLDLFKEPLNLRQENFLKNALNQLSEAVDKGETLQNVSFCDHVSSATRNSVDNDKNENTHSRTTTEKPTAIISKMNNLLLLITRFQNIQKNLNNLKKITFKNSDAPTNKSSKGSKTLKQNESESLTIFGNILERITKLLLPPLKSKRISKNIRYKNIFRNPDDIINQIKETHKIVINDESFSDKDKIVFDYLNNVQKSPNCLLENWQNSNTISRIKGDILLNLSEYLEVKSFVDLVNLIESQTKTTRSEDMTTRQPETFTTIPTKLTSKGDTKLVKTKEKLKQHMKNIIDDLIEIQNAKGQNPKNISIVDALPCLFKMLNDHDIQNKQANDNGKLVSKVDKIAAIFESLKKVLQSTSNRRSNSITGPRSKAAVVWERIIKNADGKNKQQNRRLFNENYPKTFEELKKQIDQVEFGSKMYKNKVLVGGVLPSERLTLLKTLLEDVKKNIKILVDINTSLPNLKDISVDRRMDLIDFVHNAAATINLNKNIVKNINKVITKEELTQKEKQKKYEYAQKYMKGVDHTAKNNWNNVKLSRDAIINQLIKNRMKLYITIKESKGTDLSNDINYDIAKKILVYLDIGNYSLARELYKVLISEKQTSPHNAVYGFQVPPSKKSEILIKEPVVKFVEPKSQFNKESWLKQMVNLESMKA